MARKDTVSAGSTRASQHSIYNDLRSGIESGGYLAGTRLPTERALAEEYGVSRKLVRQALESLSKEGLIERRVGSGTYVRGPVSGHASNWETPVPSVSPLDAIEVRRIIEVGVVELIVARANDDDFVRMQRRLSVMESCDDASAFRAAAFAFNQEVIDSAHNPLLTSMYRMLIEARVKAGWNRLGYLVDSEKERSQSCASNRTFLELLRKRSGREAAETRYRNLSKLIARILSQGSETH